MNAVNDNNDPFEDIFRNRFADFESEPSEFLWHKIEPQLPAKPARRFPYWQISALILGLFLSGIYFTRNLADQSLPYLTQLDNRSLSLKENLPHLSESKTNKKEIPYLLEPRTDFRSLSSREILPYLLEIVAEKESNKLATVKTEVIDNQINNYFNRSVNTKIFNHQVIDRNPFFMASNNISTNPLNPSNSEQSNQEITERSIIEPNNKYSKVSNTLSHTLELKSVYLKKDKSFTNKRVLTNIESQTEATVTSTLKFVERKNILSILDTKPYELLVNHFKTAKIKFVTVPKEEVYYKEKKPLEFYASAMPLLNYYTITPNGNDANYVHNISVNDDGDRVGFYTQAGLVFTLSDRIKLRTGLTFTKTNHSISYRVRTDSLVVQPADNKGVDVSFADLNKTYSQSANYLGTKIELQYVFLRGEALTHYVSIGGEAAYRLNGNHGLNGFANFAYGITRQIGENAYLFVEPTFSYSLNQQSDNSSLLLVKPNKIGFNVGVNFKIK